MDAKEITIDVSDLGELLVEVFQKGARQGRREAENAKVELGRLTLDVDQLRAVMQRVRDEAPIDAASETYWRSEMEAAISATKPRAD